VYGDQQVFNAPYRSSASGDAFLKTAARPTKEAMQYVKDVCNYVYDTYGRFPAHVNAMHVPGVWLQVSHLELEYYDKFFDESLYHWQAKHSEIWGAH